MTHSLENDLALMTDAAKKAASMALRTFGRDPSWRKKAGGEPVSETDIAIDRFLRERFRTERPEYGWLSEETADDRSRLDRRRCIIVDPIDGTRAFLRGRPDFCVSIGLSEGEDAVAGVLAAPAVDAFYAARKGGGAVKNGAPIRIADPQREGALKLYASAQFCSRLERKADVLEKPISSALCVAHVAEGVVDATVALAYRHEWDLAGAAVILEEAGGVLVDRAGRPWRFNTERPKREGMIAAAPSLMDTILTRAGAFRNRRGAV